jgi:hypothetical protein
MKRQITLRFWCLHCERVSVHRAASVDSLVAGIWCPFDDCNASPIDMWSWTKFRRLQAKRDLPELPEHGARIAAYPTGSENNAG